VSQSHLLIFGASARAAAFSALRAGLRPCCADLFADADLRARCVVHRVDGADYPRRFLQLLDAGRPGPWMYSGGLENWPALVAKLERRRPLWGNGPRSLALARSPWAVADLLRHAGMLFPDIQPPGAQPFAEGRWLIKPLQGAGGRRIEIWDGRPIARRRAYVQRHVPGESYAAVYLGDGDEASLLGLTRQFVGEEWTHAAPFHYCGSVGPAPLDAHARQQLERIGTILAAGCGLRGLFGVDFILNDQTFWPVEINPRYTASVEVVEYATGLKALAFHRMVFEADLPKRLPKETSAGRVVGKAILFAKDDLVFPTGGPWAPVLQSPGPIEEMPAFADLPVAGESIRAGQPILTFFTRADSNEACLDTLREIAADLDRWLFTR
jgi:predicted ATP-grasp superfamily ATP-dependent carboligase